MTSRATTNMSGSAGPDAASGAAAIAVATTAACRRIPPLWPLDATVAVNPFLGQTGEDLATAAARLGRTAGIAVIMPRSWYRERVRDGRTLDADLAAALADCPHAGKPADLAALKAALAADAPAPRPIPNVADLAAEASGIDWPGLIADRITAWAAGHFDAGQALWTAPTEASAWQAWRSFAMRDLTPEIQGLTGFCRVVSQLSLDSSAALAQSVDRLGLRPDGLDVAFHKLLITLGGWAQLARCRLWQAELAGGTDATLADLLAIRACWEAALLDCYREEIADAWTDAACAYEAPVHPDVDQIIDAILQEATDRAEQRRLAGWLAEPAAEPPDARPDVQAAFCIDVRSEVFRRALESLSPGIRTLGFAGFFGLAVAHRGFASDVVEGRHPVLLTASVCTRSEAGSTHPERTALGARISARARRAWGRFRLAAVSSFAFVEAVGPLYLGKLVQASLFGTGKSLPEEPAPVVDPELSLDRRAEAAETVLRAMSLTEGFARVVMLAGHAARVANNPHESALQCGACGGYSGEVNARLLAGLLNDPAVRQRLVGRGIVIPVDTLFIGALHDTTTDSVKLYEADHPAAGHAPDLARLRSWLRNAGGIARTERAQRLPGASNGAAVAARSRDWAEIRPEWGLAGCRAFIAAPRARTGHAVLGGQAFLHDYDWRKDDGFRVLELILTAPVVVASWISLQYYGSAVAPSIFGAGNKLLHNVTGGIGVLEGNGGPLRAGLPWQSVHDGDELAHEPLRLSVCVEAPCAAIGDILDRHDEVRALFDNRWLHLFALDDAGRFAFRRTRSGAWEPVARAEDSVRDAAA